jgi:hypothetical protein
MLATDDLAVLRAKAGDLRSLRNLNQIRTLCEKAPSKVAGHTGLLALMERILTTASGHDGALGDWFGAWAQVHMMLHPKVERFDIDAPCGLGLGDRTAGILQLLDAALIAACEGTSSMVSVTLVIRHVRGGVSVRMDCAGGWPAKSSADAVVAMATAAGVPAAWRTCDGISIFAVLIGVGPARTVSIDQ